jgi:UPF0755 protein
MSKGKRYIIKGISAILLTLLLMLLWVAYPLFSPMSSTNTPDIITLDRATSASQFVRSLEEKKLIHARKRFLALIRFKGLTNQLKAGVYQIKAGESANQLLSRVVAGDVLFNKFSIIAGTKQEKIEQDLKQAPYLNYDSNDWSFVSEGHPNAEGMLLADTYQYPAGSFSKSVLKQAHGDLQAYLQKAWSKRALNLPYKSPYELLIAASIIEKESAQPQERKIIAGVVVNRIKKGMPLQMDPTVIYGLSTNYKGKLSHQHLLIPTPYNTYLNRGLPPTPIAAVGREAIDAAAIPEPSNYLYYVSKGDGTHQFSENYEQQKRAVEKYQRKDL